MLTIKTKKLTGPELRSLKYGELVYRSKGPEVRGLRFVGFMPGGNSYLIFSDGEYLTYLYLRGGKRPASGDWYPSSLSLLEFDILAVNYYLAQIKARNYRIKEFDATGKDATEYGVKVHNDIEAILKGIPLPEFEGPIYTGGDEFEAFLNGPKVNSEDEEIIIVNDGPDVDLVDRLFDSPGPGLPGAPGIAPDDLRDDFGIIGGVRYGNASEVQEKGLKDKVAQDIELNGEQEEVFPSYDVIPEEDRFVIGSRVLYIPNHANGDRSHKDVKDGIVSKVDYSVIPGKVWVRYSTGTTGARTPIKNLVKK